MGMAAKTSLLIFFILLLVAAIASAADTTTLPDVGESSTEFIRARCAVTRYHRLCFVSLTPYADQVQLNPAELARIAANLTLVHLALLSSHITVLRRTASGREAAALRDCAETLGDAAVLAKQTVGELKGLAEAVGAEVGWRVANAQTWMSATLTNEDTCIDGFAGVFTGGDDKVDVCLRVARVEEYTSNALSLINSLVDTI